MKKENDIVITVLGAAGKMGRRITEKLYQRNYQLLLCEKGAGLESLRQRGFIPTSQEEAVPASDVIIMAIPDRILEPTSFQVVPLMKPGSILIYLDATVPYFGKVAFREDCTFVATHPCHPPLFGDEETQEARQDFFGGIAKQDIVIALIGGQEEKLKLAQQICEEFFAPVNRTYRITLEHMALLEPGMAEVIAVPVTFLLKEALEEVVKKGVPREAALAFLLGHVRIDLAILLGGADIQFSDACQVALKRGYELLVKPDWRKALERDVLQAIAREMIEKS